VVQLGDGKLPRYRGNSGAGTRRYEMNRVKMCAQPLSVLDVLKIELFVCAIYAMAVPVVRRTLKHFFLLIYVAVFVYTVRKYFYKKWTNVWLARRYKLHDGY